MMGDDHEKGGPRVRFTENIVIPSSSSDLSKSYGISPAIDSFNTGKEAFTPKIKDVHYKNYEERAQTVLAPKSSLTRPNYEDNLRRVSVVLHQHIMKCEALMARKMKAASSRPPSTSVGIFNRENIALFSEENFLIPKYTYQFVQSPITRVGFLYGVVPMKYCPMTPDLADIHKFLFDIFVRANLTAECSIVCLIYIERLMEVGNVPLVAETWKPIVLCGLLLASKVWQDVGSWNCEIAEVCPEYSLQAINQLERTFCVTIKWNLYISSSVYAKYYFALRSLAEKNDFRR